MKIKTVINGKEEDVIVLVKPEEMVHMITGECLVGSSIYKGCKNVYISSYEGDAIIKDIPNNMKKSDIVDLARQAIQIYKGKPIVYLNNVGYRVLNGRDAFDDTLVRYY